MSRIGIIAALSCELRTLAPHRKEITRGKVVETPEGHLLCLAGAGAHNAASVANKLVERGADRLLSWGLAGALAPHIESGALMVPECVLGRDGKHRSVDADWRRQVLDNLRRRQYPVHGSTLAESPSVLTSKTAKNRLHMLTNALAVDMESAAAARVADTARLPFLCIRVVIDALDRDLPDWITDDAGQAIDLTPKTVFSNAIRSPRSWLALTSLAVALARGLYRLRVTAPVVFAGSRNREQGVVARPR